MSRLKNNLLNKVFGKLTVIDRAPNRIKSNVVMWVCFCECGNSKIVQGSSLSSGASKSCGCEQWQVTHNMSKSSEFISWAAAKGRISNPNNPDWGNYGGRGILMSPEWFNSFEQFYHDMGDKPSSSHSLDRIDVDGNYCKENCRWGTPSEQSYNQRQRSDNKSGRTGVCWSSYYNKWSAYYYDKEGNFIIKHFQEYEEAVIFREAGELIVYGELKPEARSRLLK